MHCAPFKNIKMKYFVYANAFLFFTVEFVDNIFNAIILAHRKNAIFSTLQQYILPLIWSFHYILLQLLCDKNHPYSLYTFVIFSKNNNTEKKCQIINKHNLDYTESFYLPSLSLIRYMFRSKPLERILWGTALKICSIFTEEYPYRSVISIKLLCIIYF